MSPNAKIEAAALLLQRIQDEFSPASFASSLGAEDMVLTDLIAKHAPAIGIFSLDTGRLNPETYDLLARAQETYGQTVTFRVFYPQTEDIQRYVDSNGINAFYQSVEFRKSCCSVRKVEPLKRALAGQAAWITGMRRQQAVTRANMEIQEFDEAHGLQKFNPLAEWTINEVWEYIHANAVPYNALHDQHYPSIGCAPCTRSIALGEDVRAGRWWWEDEAGRECGLHVKK